jgi:uncharacterized membrane protein YdjX (TVP38/TMEM64 family)
VNAAIVDGLRGVRAGVVATTRQVSRRRLVVTAVAIVILVAVAVLVPLPTAVQLRDWAISVGPWFPLAFLATHILVTTFPFPRTAFTLAAGLMFGAWLGVVLAVLASALSAVIALLLVRAVGWQLSRLVAHPSVDTLNSRLRRRGWVAVLWLRLIPVVPFSVVNYAAGASAVRVVPFTLASVVGLLPGTVAVVVLGDALTGHVNPLLVLVSAATGCVGLVGLGFEARAHRREDDGALGPAGSLRGQDRENHREHGCPDRGRAHVAGLGMKTHGEHEIQRQHCGGQPGQPRIPADR